MGSYCSDFILIIFLILCFTSETQVEMQEATFMFEALEHWDVMLNKCVNLISDGFFPSIFALCCNTCVFSCCDVSERLWEMGLLINTFSKYINECILCIWLHICIHYMLQGFIQKGSFPSGNKKKQVVIKEFVLSGLGC